MTTTVSGLAATTTLALLCGGASPSQAFLAGHIVCTPKNARITTNTDAISARSGSTRPRAGFYMSTLAPSAVSAAEAASSPEDLISSGPAAGDSEGTGTAKEANADADRRWINDMKAGQKVIGYVADTTRFAAFVEVGVVRRGAKGKIMPVTGFLHQSEVRHPYALEGSSRVESCDVEVKKGIHLTAYVKDVFPNAGRLTLSLDPDISKDKVLKMRDSKRQRSRASRRDRIAEKGEVPDVGDVVEGYVRKVQGTMLLVDVMYAQLSVLRASKIRDSHAGGSFVTLTDKVKAGDRITVRVDRVETNKRKGNTDKKAIISFLGWGSGHSEAGEEGTANESTPHVDVMISREDNATEEQIQEGEGSLLQHPGPEEERSLSLVEAEGDDEDALA